MTGGQEIILDQLARIEDAIANLKQNLDGPSSLPIDWPRARQDVGRIKVAADVCYAWLPDKRER